MSRRPRPRSILWFERLFVAACLLRLLNLYLAWRIISLWFNIVAALWSWPAVAATFALGWLLPILAAWLTGRRANRVAAWLLAIWLCLDALSVVVPLLLHRSRIGPIMTVGLLVCALYLASVVALTLPASRQWFSKKRTIAEIAEDFA